MATVFTHPLLPLATALAVRSKVSGTLLAAACLCTVLPDFDVIAFALGIPYHHPLGHRGASHSLVFAIGMGLLGMWGARSLRSTRPVAFWWLFLATASHGILDALTNGGLGVAFLWPLDSTRYFFPWRPLEVSPIGLRSFLEGDGLAVLGSEWFWIGIPCAVVVVLSRVGQRILRDRLE